MPVRLSQFDQIGAQSLRSLFDELLEVNVTTAILVGTLKDLFRLLFCDPAETERLQGIAYFLFAELAVSVRVSCFEHLLQGYFTEP